MGFIKGVDKQFPKLPLFSQALEPSGSRRWSLTDLRLSEKSDMHMAWKKDLLGFALRVEDMSTGKQPRELDRLYRHQTVENKPQVLLNREIA